jgi:hypothetical protein
MTKAIRALRIAGIALAFVVVFTISQQATLARSGETVPGTLWALGALSVFFLIGAFGNEISSRPQADVRKDLLWGLGLGGIVAIAARLVSA